MAIERDELLRALRESGADWVPVEPEDALEGDELARLCGYVPGPGEPSLAEREAISADRNDAGGGVARGVLPQKLDLRSHGGADWTTPIRDQGPCGSCVAFGVTAAVEGTLKRQAGDPSLQPDLSEAHLFFCLGERACGVGGWWVGPALDAYRDRGVVDEPAFPYRPVDQRCGSLRSSAPQRLTRISGWHTYATVESMKGWLLEHGPLVTCFSVYEDFGWLGTGVYRHVTGGFTGGHCVCIVGWDDVAGAWIAKNSWGTVRHDQGWFRIAYGEVGIDAEMWAVQDVLPPEYPRVHAYRTSADKATRVVYRTAEDRVQEVWSVDGATWTAGDLTTAARSSAVRTEVSGFAAGDAALVLHGNGVLHASLLELSGTPRAWRGSDPSALAGLPPSLSPLPGAAVASTPRGYLSGHDGVVRVVYRGVDGLVHELARVPGQPWQHSNLSHLSGAPVGVVGEPVGYYDPVERCCRVVFRGTDVHVHELYLLPGAGWGHGDLTAMSGAPATPGGRVVGLATGRDRACRVLSTGWYGEVDEIYLLPGDRWRHGALASAVAAPPAAGGVTAYEMHDGGPRVVYRGHDRHVHQLALPHGQGWSHADLTAAAGGAQAAGDPVGCGDDPAGREVVAYRGLDGSVRLLTRATTVWTDRAVASPR